MTAPAVRVAFLGPEGTFSEEALLARAGGEPVEPVPLASVPACVAAVRAGDVERAVVPIENSLEGSVNATLDALVREATSVEVAGESVHHVEHCLIAARDVGLEEIETVVSHPQSLAQCARFLAERLARARTVAASSNAEAVRTVAEQPERPWAALGPRRAAGLYGARVLAAGVQDEAGNQTRFAWLARRGDEWRLGDGAGPWKTSVAFWGPGAGGAGWLVRCLSEFAFRGVNLVRIESRPSREGLGSYRFFVDLEGRTGEEEVDAALAALERHCETVLALGSFPAAADPG